MSLTILTIPSDLLEYVYIKHSKTVLYIGQMQDCKLLRLILHIHVVNMQANPGLHIENMSGRGEGGGKGVSMYCRHTTS